MPAELSPIHVFSARGQCVALLFSALHELGGSNTKREVISFIGERRWFAKQREDWKPYPTQTEPRWHTLIAWGRKDSVIRDFVLNNERDSWALSHEGRRVWASALRKFATHDWQVSQGYLWSAIFKRYLCSDYQPSSVDATRPPNFYKT